MQINEANIEIVRQDEKLFSIALQMPKWNKIGLDGTITVKMPLFGLKTYATNDEDAETAAEEAIKSFCLMAEKFGEGLEKELELLGWTLFSVAENKCNLVFNVSDTDFVFEQVLQTGEQFANANLQIA